MCRLFDGPDAAFRRANGSVDWDGLVEDEFRQQISECTVKNAVELFFAFHPDVEKIQYH
jgi:hypothetical protein